MLSEATRALFTFQEKFLCEGGEGDVDGARSPTVLAQVFLAAFAHLTEHLLLHRL